MSMELDRKFFEDLASMNIHDVCQRTLCRYDDEKKSYSVEAWGETYLVSPDSKKILDSAGMTVNIETGLVILFYLMRAREVLVTGEWISEKDIPGGVTFFTGPHAIPAHLITRKFGNDIEPFKRACTALGGEEVNMGDAAFIFRVLKRVPVTVLMWMGDDEFGPDAKILFDRSISMHIPMDVIFALSVETLRRISSYEQK